MITEHFMDEDISLEELIRAYIKLYFWEIFNK